MQYIVTKSDIEKVFEMWVIENKKNVDCAKDLDDYGNETEYTKAATRDFIRLLNNIN